MKDWDLILFVTGLAYLLMDFYLYGERSILMSVVLTIGNWL